MIKKILNAFLVGALFLCALGTVSSCTDYDDDIANLNERVDELESATDVSIASVQDQIDAINSTITSLDTDLQSQIDDLTSSLSSLGVDVTSLQASLESQISELETSLKAYVDGEISDVETLISNLEATFSKYYTQDEVDALLADLKSTLEAYADQSEADANTYADQSEADANTYSDAQNEALKTELQDYVNTLLLQYYTSAQLDEMFEAVYTAIGAETTLREAAIATLNTRIDSTNLVAAGINLAVSNLSTTVDDIDDALDKLTTTVGNNTTNISTNASDISDLKEALEELSTNLSDNYVTNTSLSETLGSYATTKALSDAQTYLEGLIDACYTKTEVENLLLSYVTSENLATILASYVKSDDLTTTLSNYVTTTVYNAAIEEITKDIEALEGTLTVEGLKDIVLTIANTYGGYASDEDLTALETTVNTLVQEIYNTVNVDELATLDSRIDEIISTLGDISETTVAQALSDLQAAITLLNTDVFGEEGTTDDLKTLINDLTTIVSGEGGLSATLTELKEQLYGEDGTGGASGDLYTINQSISALQTTLGDTTSGLVKQVNDLESEYDEFVAKFESITTNCDDWFGTSFATYLQTSVTSWLTNSSAGEEDNALYFSDMATFVSSMYELQESVADYQTELSDLIGEWTNLSYDAEGNLVAGEATTITAAINLNATQISALNSALSDLQADVEDIFTRLSDVESRIQSLVYAPTYTDGKVYFDGAQYVTLGEETIYLSNATTPSNEVEVNFYVSPADLATTICTSEDWEWSIKEYEATIKTKADSDSYIKIVNKEPGANGLITLTLQSNYKFEDLGNTTLMFAVHVEKAASSSLNDDANKATYGTSYTTEFIEIATDDSADVTPNFVLGYTDGTSYYIASETTFGGSGEGIYYAAEIPYIDDSESIEFFSDEAYQYQIVFNDGGTALSLEQAATKYGWTNASSIFTGSEVEAEIELGDISDNSPSKENYSYSNAKEEQTSFSLANHLTSMIGNTVTATYKYYITDGKNNYAAAVTAKDVRTIVAADIKVEAETQTFTWDYTTAVGSKVYTQSCEITFDTAAECDAFFAEAGADSKEETFTLSSDFETKVTLAKKADGDGKTMTATIVLTGDLSVSGSYENAIVADYSANGSTIKATIPVEVVGAPDAVEVDLEDIEITYVAETKTYALDASVIELAKAKLQEITVGTEKTAWDQYGSDDNFTAALNAATWVSDSWTYVQVTYSNGTLSAEFADAAEVGETYNEGSTKAYTSSWTYNSQNNAKPIVTVNVNSITLAPNETVQNAKLTVNSEKLTVTPTISGSEGSASFSAIVNLSEIAGYNEDGYSVTYDLETVAHGLASISGSTLNWGDWDELTLDVTATLAYGSYVCDTTDPFTLTLTEPITGDLTFNNGSNLEIDTSVGSVNVAEHLGGLTCAYSSDDIFTDTGVHGTYAYALGASLSYGTATIAQTSGTTTRISFSDGVLTIGSGDAIVGTVTVSIPVTFTYRFNTYTTTAVFEITEYSVSNNR